ncbi:hypothetical protein R1H25_17780 [Stenotrophomonas sp. C2852]|uniref:hypothetical protein n=1 Tax=Stenotrophomonas sp. C2852 TaxID=3077845 RepID=UPI00293C4532|nr:hypothetical protein [Stenotrophomonas sp. C2852]MDV3437313.1 hypothetical protein [Stenotrophomonas sp. C2852]
MLDLISCPYCFREAQHGIRVCQGCRSEVHYGAPREAHSAALLATLITSLYLAVSVHVIVGGAAFFIMLIGLSKFINQKYKNRVVFKRIFLTR